MLAWLHIIIDSEHFDCAALRLAHDRSGGRFQRSECIAFEFGRGHVDVHRLPRVGHAPIMDMEECVTKLNRDEDEDIETAKGALPGQALRDSEARYRRLFETAQDGVLILDAKTGLITDVNPFLIKLLDYSVRNFSERHSGTSACSRISSPPRQLFES